MRKSIIIPICLILFCSCLSHKSATETTSIIAADNAAESSASVAEVRHGEQNTDSMFNSWFSRMSQLHENQVQEREQVTETVSSHTDSLGREIREMKRTTDRSISRQEQIMLQQWAEQQMKEIEKTTKYIDSLLFEMENRLSMRWDKNISESKETEPERPDYISGVAAVLIIILLVFFLLHTVNKMF